MSKEELRLQKQLTDGVVLNLVPTTQFKTISVTVDFIAPADVSALSNRILLAQLLETSSGEYPTQTKLAEKLSWMYGASYGVNVFRYGQSQGLRFSATIVNDQFLGGESLLAELLAFLRSVIDNPLASDGAFDAETFERQQQNLIAYLKSLNDDKQYYAERRLNELYFKTAPFFATSLYGDPATIAGITPASLYADYQTMLATNQVQITIAGDVSLATVEPLLADWQLAPRTTTLNHLLYQRPAQAVVSEQEGQPLQQSKLNMAYRLPVYYRQADFYKALVFNGLFGGTPISMLFKNVREKHSLAYYASSRFDGFTGTLTVQTGIDQSNEEAVKTLIGEQLTAIKNGEFTDEQFDQVVASLINGRESRLDSARSLINQAVLDTVTQTHVSAEEWVNHLHQVTREDVCQIAAQVELQAVFFLRGENSWNSNTIQN